MTDCFADVGDFHRKFGLPAFPGSEPPRLLTDRERPFRAGFLMEESAEFLDAAGHSYEAKQLHGLASSIRNQTGPRMVQHLPHQVDALLDLVYVALGTLHLMGINADLHWTEIQRANMAKERCTDPATSKRASTLDVVKPLGWTPPDHTSILRRCGWTG